MPTLIGEVTVLVGGNPDWSGKAMRVLRSHLTLVVIFLGMTLVSELRAQDPIAEWTNLLRHGSLSERVDAMSSLAMQDQAFLPPATVDAIIAELNRISDALFLERDIPGIAALDGESFGEYFVNLSVAAAVSQRADAFKAIIRSVDVSRGIQRRVARHGDQVVPPLSDMIDRRYQEVGAVHALALAWFWADSTGSPLSDASRRTILEHLVEAANSEEYSLRLAVAVALGLTGDPAFLPLAVMLLNAESTSGDPALVAILRNQTIPQLQDLEDDLTTLQLVQRIRRSITLYCSSVSTEPRHGLCTSIENQVTTAVKHTREGRLTPARNVVSSMILKVDMALNSGQIDEAEHALIANGLRLVLSRL